MAERERINYVRNVFHSTQESATPETQLDIREQMAGFFMENIQEFSAYHQIIENREYMTRKPGFRGSPNYIRQVREELAELNAIGTVILNGLVNDPEKLNLVISQLGLPSQLHSEPIPPTLEHETHTAAEDMLIHEKSEALISDELNPSIVKTHFLSEDIYIPAESATKTEHVTEPETNEDEQAILKMLDQGWTYASYLKNMYNVQGLVKDYVEYIAYKHGHTIERRGAGRGSQYRLIHESEHTSQAQPETQFASQESKNGDPTAHIVQFKGHPVKLKDDQFLVLEYLRSIDGYKAKASSIKEMTEVTRPISVIIKELKEIFGEEYIAQEGQRRGTIYGYSDPNKEISLFSQSEEQKSEVILQPEIPETIKKEVKNGNEISLHDLEAISTLLINRDNVTIIANTSASRFSLPDDFRSLIHMYQEKLSDYLSQVPKEKHHLYMTQMENSALIKLENLLSQEDVFSTIENYEGETESFLLHIQVLSELPIFRGKFMEFLQQSPIPSENGPVFELSKDLPKNVKRFLKDNPKAQNRITRVASEVVKSNVPTSMKYYEVPDKYRRLVRKYIRRPEDFKRLTLKQGAGTMQIDHYTNTDIAFLALIEKHNINLSELKRQDVVAYRILIQEALENNDLKK